MKIEIKNLIFETIIGILQEERLTPQKVIVDIEIDYNYIENSFIDYVIISEIVQKSMKQKKYLLIENALEDIVAILKNRFPNIDTIYIKIIKPNILQNAQVGVSLKKSFKNN